MDDLDGGDLFADPPGYYPSTPPPTTEQHALGRSGVQLTLHLVGHSVLEAHRLWNGSRVLADYLEEQQAIEEAAVTEMDPVHQVGRIRGRTVLELGAGAALPGIVCGLVLGARRVVVTDYPDPDVVATMQRNIAEAEAGAAVASLSVYAGPGTIRAAGLVWGGDAAPIVAMLDDLEEQEERNGTTTTGGTTTTKTTPGTRRFDVVLLADLLFRHGEHAHLARSVADTLAHHRDSRAYVFFTSYRPWLRHKDLAFFGHAIAAGFVVEHLLERRLAQPPLFFADDPGDVAVRSTVSGYALRWPQEGEQPGGWSPGEGEAEAEADKKDEEDKKDKEDGKKDTDEATLAPAS